MDRKELMNKLQEIFVDVFDDDKIKIEENTSAEDIKEWDSLTNISILAAVQEEFSVTFEIDEIISMENVGEILDAILRKLQ